MGILIRGCEVSRGPTPHKIAAIFACIGTNDRTLPPFYPDPCPNLSPRLGHRIARLQGALSVTALTYPNLWPNLLNLADFLDCLDLLSLLYCITYTCLLSNRLG